MRDLTKVVLRIIELIPEDVKGRGEVVYRLKRAVDNCLYMAPEAMQGGLMAGSSGGS